MPSVVVDVDPRLSEIDAAKLRAAIGAELSAQALAPGDPGAAQARGTITVSIERAAHTLVVSYREQGAPVERSIDLPRDAKSVARAAVLLAGNLARDQAQELLAELRKKEAPEGSGQAEATPLTATPERGRADSAVDTQLAGEARDVERIGAMLASAADSSRSGRTAVAWAVIGAGLLAEAGGIYLGVSGHSDAGLVLDFGSLALFPIGFSLLPNGRLDQLRTYYDEDRALGRPAWMVRDDVERLWVREAQSEHRSRRFAGWFGTLGGAFMLTVGGIAIADTASNGADHSQLAWESGALLCGLTTVAWGVQNLNSDGPVESALHDYELASARHVPVSGQLDVGPRLSLVSGGGVLGVGGRF